MRDRASEIFRKIEEIKKQEGITYPITVIGASKMVDADTINLLPSLGINTVGENKVQELLEKYDKVFGLQWHFIGALQTNKVKYIIDKVTLIHSLDRPSLADEIDKQARKIGKKMDVLVEVNTGREPTKSGVFPEDAYSFMHYVTSKPNLNLRGVMGVFPVGADEALYEELRKISDFAKENYGADILSAGMSNDYETAIKHGSNMVRIGSALFGKRNYN